MTFAHQAACLRPSSGAEPTRPHLGPIGKTGCKNDNARDKSATGIAIGQGRSRTVDTAVFSRMLYRLSYLPALFFTLSNGRQPVKPVQEASGRRTPTGGSVVAELVLWQLYCRLD